MRIIAIIALSGALGLAIGAAHAQPAGNATTAPPPATGGMGPGMMGGGAGMGPHGMGGPGHMGANQMGGGMRAGPGYTMGWSMMTPQERREHRTKMMSFTDAKACRAYVEEHHRLMAERAKQRGVAIPPNPMHDPCAGLK